MRIAIIGCGWVGVRLSKFLQDKNHHIVATTTSLDKISFLKEIATEVHLLDFSVTKNFDFLNGFDVAIFSMPISQNLWFKGFKNLNIKFPKTILFSSTGVYPPENKTFTENHSENLRPDIFASENVVKEKYPETNILRLGGLMGDNRNLQEFFKNKFPENPQKKVNYIHYEDILAMVEHIIHSNKKAETYNLVAPEHPNIATILDIKNQIIQEKNQRIISSEHFIQDFNYKFIHPNPNFF